MKVLLCGHRSMASQGLIESLRNTPNVELDCFSRGEESEQHCIIEGNVFEMSNNPYLQKDYDVVVNFIIIQGDYSIKDNLAYLGSLLNFCKKNKVKKLIHISTISVYPNNIKYVNEMTPIEHNSINKGIYAEMKVECDQFLMKEKTDEFKIVFVRPGYVITDKNTIRTGGILIPVFLNYGLLLGNKKTSLPLINRNKMVSAITNIIVNDYPLDVYLLLENKRGTKYDYIKKYTQYKTIILPKQILIVIAKLLKTVHIINETKYQQITGLFKDTYFDSSLTEKILSIKF